MVHQHPAHTFRSHSGSAPLKENGTDRQAGKRRTGALRLEGGRRRRPPRSLEPDDPRLPSAAPRPCGASAAPLRPPPGPRTALVLAACPSWASEWPRTVVEGDHPRPIDGPAHPTTRRGGGHVGVWLRCGSILTGEIVRPGPYPPSEPYLRLEVQTASLGPSLPKI